MGSNPVAVTYALITLGKQMSNYYAPCFYRIDSVIIPSYEELLCLNTLSWSKNALVGRKKVALFI